MISYTSSTLQNRLCWNPEAPKLRHRAEEGRDGHRTQKHSRPNGVPRPHQPAQRQDRVFTSRVQPYRVL